MAETSLSVVIPTFYRARSLEKTLHALLRSDVRDLGRVEIIVVDDGSPVPVEPVVQRISDAYPDGLALRLIKQPNSGPAAARNRGFFDARGTIVLFMDDDILPPQDLLRAHCEAHKRHPGVVVHGPCVFAPDNGSAKLRRYLNQLSPDPDPKEEFRQISMVASGQISVEREMFRDGGVYRTDLKTPAAEEFELASRLKQCGIPILQAARIVAIHDQVVAIRDICAQQYKHAIGYAEVAQKYPEARGIADLDSVLQQNGPLTSKDSRATKCKKIVKSCLSGKKLRKILIAILNPIGEALPFRSSAAIFHFLVGLYFFAGVRDGISLFSSGKR